MFCYWTFWLLYLGEYDCVKLFVGVLDLINHENRLSRVNKILKKNPWENNFKRNLINLKLTTYIWNHIFGFCMCKYMPYMS